jgi:hypothetical protein
MNEEAFNVLAYNYRSWPASDVDGVSNRYKELLAVFEEQEAIIEELRFKLLDALFELEYARRSNEIRGIQ